MRTGVWTVLWGLGCAVSLSGAHAEIRQYSESRVDYLVGGSAARAPSAVAPRPVTTTWASPSGAAGPRKPALMTPDDDGRREILQLELDKARAAANALNGSAPPVAGAGTLAEQRARVMSDVASLEAELRRMKR